MKNVSQKTSHQKVLDLADDQILVQIGIKPKRSLLPHNPCTHFVERRAYADALLQFFKPHSSHSQIFVLWGLGGIG
jgi:hypothetical protein